MADPDVVVLVPADVDQAVAVLESGRIELLASIELLKNNITTHKNIPNFQFGWWFRDCQLQTTERSFEIFRSFLEIKNQVNIVNLKAFISFLSVASVTEWL